MAAATWAILGSSLGVFGTVGGAGAGSIASIVITWLCERSIERAQRTVSCTVKLPGDSSSRQHPSSLDTVKTECLSPEGTARSGWHRRGRRLAVGALMIFLMGWALVTGIELTKGSPLSGGGGGTSVARVLRAAPPPPTTPPVADARGDQQRRQPDDAHGGEAASDNAGRDSGTDADEPRAGDSHRSGQDQRHRDDSNADSSDRPGDGGSGDISGRLTPADPPNPQEKVLGVLPSSPDTGRGIGVLPGPDQRQSHWSEPGSD